LRRGKAVLRVKRYIRIIIRIKDNNFLYSLRQLKIFIFAENRFFISEESCLV